MICLNCGKDNAPTSKFCASCGQRLNGQPTFGVNASTSPLAGASTGTGIPAVGGMSTPNTTPESQVPPAPNGMPSIPLPPRPQQQTTAQQTPMAQQTPTAQPMAPDAFDKANTTWTLMDVMKERTLIPFIVALIAFVNFIGEGILAIPIAVGAYVVGAVLTMLYLQWRGRPHVEEALVRYCRAKGIDPRTQMKFTWYSYYSTIMGFALWAVIATLLGLLLMQVAGDEAYTDINLAMLTTLVPMVLSYFIAKYAVKLITKAIYARSRTNDLRIAAISEGYYAGEFKDVAEQNKVILMLSKNRAHSVAGAKHYISLMSGLKKAGIIGGIITAILSILTFGALAKLGKDFELEMSPMARDRAEYDAYIKDLVKRVNHYSGNGFIQRTAGTFVQGVSQQVLNDIFAQNLADRINHNHNGGMDPNQNGTAPTVDDPANAAKQHLNRFGSKS